MRRALLGLLLVLHGLAHVNAGMLAAGAETPGAIAPRGAIGAWVATALWGVAMVGFVVAGLALLGGMPRRVRWRSWALAAAVASLAMFALYRPPTMIPGMLIDLSIVALAVLTMRDVTWAERPIGTSPGVEAAPGSVRRVFRVAGHVAALSFVAYLVVLVALRPWHMRWGVTDEERRAALPGDEVQAADAHYRIDHGVTIAAPVDSVWAWVAQVGQDRAGFYSYDWLERLFGDDIRNANRLVPEWQDRKVGDLVRAAQPDYLGGRFGRDLGWRIEQFVPNRVMVLRGWGAFIVQPVDARTTRLLVRTRGGGEPNVALAPFGFLVFEPAHFIMERGMLIGIKARAEGRIPG